jgi:hypothetical protein
MKNILCRSPSSHIKSSDFYSGDFCEAQYSFNADSCDIISVGSRGIEWTVALLQLFISDSSLLFKPRKSWQEVEVLLFLETFNNYHTIRIVI